MHTSGGDTSTVHTSGGDILKVHTRGGGTLKVHTRGGDTSKVHTRGGGTLKVHTSGGDTSKVHTRGGDTSKVHMRAAGSTCTLILIHRRPAKSELPSTTLAAGLSRNEEGNQRPMATTSGTTCTLSSKHKGTHGPDLDNSPNPSVQQD